MPRQRWLRAAICLCSPPARSPCCLLQCLSGAESKADKHAELEAAIFSAPSGTGLSNWADDSEEEDEWGGPSGDHAHHHEEGWEEVSRCFQLLHAGLPGTWVAMCCACCGRAPCAPP